MLEVLEKKREQVFQWLNGHNYSICLLQETHLTSVNESVWKKEWKGPCFFSGNCSNKNGIGILIDSNLNCDIKQYTDITPGRVQCLELVVDEKKITIINIYGPNNDDTTVFNNLLTYMNNNSDKSFIIGGDFNTVIDCNTDKKKRKTR